MKKINFILLIIVITFITECPVKSQTNFTENFDNLNAWILWGNPLPVHHSSIHGKTGIFDNNGDPMYNSGAISKQTFDLVTGFILESEIFLDFSDSSGCWAFAEIGIADPSYQGWWGGYQPYISLGLDANGDACWVCPENTRKHLLITGGYKTSSGWENFGDCRATPIYADKYANSWQLLKIVVAYDGIPKFYIADSLIYSGSQPVDRLVLNKRCPIYLGSRSSGSAGKAYHNSIWLFPSVQETLLYENFDDLNNWTLYGDPLPNHIHVMYGKSGVFDNNGDPDYSSGAISNQTFDLSKGFILESEVYLNFFNLSGCWASAEIGIADTQYQSWGGYQPLINFGLEANGDACWLCPGITQRHTLINGSYKTQSGWEKFGDCTRATIYADQYSNSWQTIKIILDNFRIPKFFIANNLIYSGLEPVDSSVINISRPVWLGARSSGYAGKAYHNYVDLKSIQYITYINEEKALQILVFHLNQNYPNPFNSSTVISWQSPVSSWQTLKVYDILGNEVKTLVNKEMGTGYHSIDFNASDIPSGVYFYKLQAGNFIETKKMILLK